MVMMSPPSSHLDQVRSWAHSSGRAALEASGSWIFNAPSQEACPASIGDEQGRSQGTDRREADPEGQAAAVE